MSKNKTRQQKLKEGFLKDYPDFPQDKINDVLLIGGNLRGLKLGVVKVSYDINADNITFKLNNNWKKKEISVNIEKKIGYEEVEFAIYVNNNIYKEEKSIDKKVVRRIKDIINAIMLDGVYNDEEVFDVLEKISFANSLAKTNPENKGFLYAIKHAFIDYIIINHPSLVEYEKPTTLTGKEKLLEIKVGDYVFHLPYDRKNRYGFWWDENTQPEVYTKEKNREIPEDLDIHKLNVDLFNVYLKISGGKLREMKSDAVQYWYTREIMKKLYVNPDINLIRLTGDGKISNYSAQSGATYKLIDTKTEKDIGKKMAFWSFFNTAVCSGLKIE